MAAPPAREPGRQQQLGKLQQGLEYLDRLQQSLQDLKGGLSQSLAQGRTAAALPGQVEQLRQLWQQRPQQSGQQVDSQLQAATGPEGARQRFKLRGLDLAVLEQGGRETLKLQLPGNADTGNGRPLNLAVTLNGEGTQAQLQALTRALAPAGVSVQVQGSELVLSVAESQWPALRDGMTLRGEGKRFPSGQPVRALLDAEPEALQPQRWQVQDPVGQRQALGQVLQAQPRVAQARDQLDARLRAATAEVAHAPDASGLSSTEAQALASGFEARLQQAGYGQLDPLLPALRGLHKQRVQQLLSRV